MDSAPVQEDANVSRNQIILYCLVGGVFGMHHFALGRYRWGVLYLATLGVIGVWWIMDFFEVMTYFHFFISVFLLC